MQEAVKNGAFYADIRIGDVFDEILTVRNGALEQASLLQTSGFGVRDLVNGAWGFASSTDLSESEVRKTTLKAVKIALASSRLKRKDVALTHEKIRRDKYSTQMKKDPFKIPLDEKVEVLMLAERVLAEQSSLIKSSSAHFRTIRENKLFMSSEGAEITQQITICGGDIVFVAVKNGEVQWRSYSNFNTSGYEFFESLKLIDHAKDVSREAVQLLNTKNVLQ